MGESSEKFPNREVVESLWDLDIETSEKAQSMTAEVRERVSNQVELAGLRRQGYTVCKAAIRRGRKHPFDAVKDLEHLKVYADWAIDKIKRDGHVGDIAEMADQAAKQDQAAPEAPKQPEPDPVADNVVKLQKGIKPLDGKATKTKARAERDPVPANEVKAKADKAEKTSAAKQAKEGKAKDTVDALRDELKAEKSAKGSFVEQQREENAKGDAHIKAVAEGKDPSAPMPDIPPFLDRRERAEEPDKRERGKYRLLS